MELTIDQVLQKGVEAHKTGKAQEADRYYTAILKANPKHPDANHNMGVLAVGVGKVQEALPFFKTALEANPATAQFWLSYIDALIKLERLADAKAVLSEAQEKGAKGSAFDKLQQRLQGAEGKQLEASNEASEEDQEQPNILDSLKLDQAIKLAKKKAKDGTSNEAKRIYQDILVKFPKNKRAIDGMKALADKPVGKASKVQELPQKQQQSLINLYSQGQLKQALEQANILLQQFPSSSILHNICGAVYKGLGQLDSSVEAYTKALAIKPDNAEAYNNMGIALKEQGKLEEAIKAYTKAFSIKPDYVDAYYNMGIALKQQGKLEEAIQAYNKALAIKPDYAETCYNMGNALQEQGKLDEAIEAYTKALAIKPDNAEAYNNMGIALKEQGKLEEAIKAYTKAFSIKPDYAVAYYNMGIALKEQGKLEEAIEAYTKALAIKPDYAVAYYNMGSAFKEQGKLDEAIEAYTKALAIKPDYAEAYNNMGNALQEQGKLGEAIEAYTKALAIKPDYTDAYNNMGNALKQQGKLDEAIEAYTKALAIKPDNAEAYNNMGNALQEQGKLDEAIEAFNKALATKPDYAEAWNNIMFPLQALKSQVSSREELVFYYPKDTCSQHYKISKSILNFRLDQGRKSADSSLSETLELIANNYNLTITNPFGSKTPSVLKPILPNKVIALTHFGRSGTGLLHSLIDGHPEVSTLPSIYFSEYFDHSTWKKITAGGWHEMADRFVSIYEVLFDATSTVPIETKSKKLIYNIGQKEGTANVGENRNEVLRVDKKLFRAELKRLMDFYDEVDAFVFFKLAHAAFNKAISDLRPKSLIFYHIHNPDTYAQLNFVRLAPAANWVMMVREPIQSCESWLRKPFKENDYPKIANTIFGMLFEIDNIIYHKQNSIGVRLEDLKENPSKTIPTLCKWMGIKETESLYEMTAQGKKWWGDPTSPDFEKDGYDPFGKTSINRKIGSIFSERDQYILQTLFYPFSVRFGYVEENVEQFEIDLQTIRPMLDEMFDFEKMIVEQTHVDQEQFMKSGYYFYLRSGLIERWDILKEFRTYPNMIKPLEI
jgi:tetratricopeptide (TPR) repeat protein